MRIKKRPFHFFLLAVLFTIASLYLINTFPPTYVLSWKTISLPLLPGIMLLFAAAVFSFFTYLLHSYVQGLLLAAFVGIYLILRIASLTNIFFLIMLFILFGTLELFFLKKK